MLRNEAEIEAFFVGVAGEPAPAFGKGLGMAALAARADLGAAAEGFQLELVHSIVLIELLSVCRLMGSGGCEHAGQLDEASDDAKVLLRGGTLERLEKQRVSAG